MADKAPDASKEATISVNRHFEALLVKKVWYIRNKHLKGPWGRAKLPAAATCYAIKDGKLLPTANIQIVL